jgi:hypothetical protein
LVGHVKDLCETVGFSLSTSVLKAAGNVDDAAKIGNMARLTGVFEKLQDLARGVERLHPAIGKVGELRYSELCQETSEPTTHLHGKSSCTENPPLDR